MINLDQYLPILLFILVGVAIGVIPQVLGYIPAPIALTPPKILLTNAALKPSKMRA